VSDLPSLERECPDFVSPSSAGTASWTLYNQHASRQQPATSLPVEFFLLFYNQHNEKDKRNGLASFVFRAFVREGFICASGV
jgi:hypothetical protein